MAKQRPYRKSEHPDQNSSGDGNQANQQSLNRPDFGGSGDRVFGLFPRERLPLIILFFTVTIGSFVLWGIFQRPPMLDEYTYEIVDEYIHDSTSFTQGLIFEDGFLYESTGKYEQSKIRKIDLKNNQIVREVRLGDKFFGEGLCRVGDKLIQLTWREKIGYVYDLDLNRIDEFEYDSEGWGLTFDGTQLIMSVGTSMLYFLNKDTYEVENQVVVRKGASRLPDINELEWINGFIYANVFGDDMIYMIQPTDGKVVGRINFSELFPKRLRPNNESIMNGIAIRKDNGNLLVTGKNWPKIFEVKLNPVGR